jgi:hypothetical protein
MVAEGLAGVAWAESIVGNTRITARRRPVILRDDVRVGDERSIYVSRTAR